MNNESGIQNPTNKSNFTRKILDQKDTKLKKVKNLIYTSLVLFAKMGIEIGKKGTVMKVEVKNIKYDLDGMFGFECYSNGKTREEVLSSLPKSMVVEVDVYEPSGVHEKIQKIIEDQTGWLVSGFYCGNNGKFFYWEQPEKPEWRTQMENLYSLKGDAS